MLHSWNMDMEGRGSGIPLLDTEGRGSGIPCPAKHTFLFFFSYNYLIIYLINGQNIIEVSYMHHNYFVGTKAIPDAHIFKGLQCTPLIYLGIELSLRRY